jgi:K+-sensing histidine kinase KdpD
MSKAAQERPPLKRELRLPRWAHYAITIFLVAMATFLAAGVSSAVPAPGLTLVFVLPVVIAGTAYGLGPSLVATVAGVLSFDFFFTQPYLTLRIDDPSEIWAAVLLFITASIVSTVAWQSRIQALEARRAADNGEQLRSLAHAIIHGATQAQIFQAAANTISRMFGGPAAILSEIEGQLRVEALTGSVELSNIELEAAKGALTSDTHLRARMYPFEQSAFDMWPITTSAGDKYVLSVDLNRAENERPADADRLIEIVAGYIVANPARPPAR